MKISGCWAWVSCCLVLSQIVIGGMSARAEEDPALSDPGYKSDLSRRTTVIQADGSSVTTVEESFTITTAQGAMEKSHYTVQIPISAAQFKFIEANVQTGSARIGVEPEDVQKSDTSVNSNFVLYKVVKYVIPFPRVRVGSHLSLKYQLIQKPLIKGVFFGGAGISNQEFADFETQIFISEKPLHHLTRGFDDVYTLRESKDGGRSRLDILPTSKARLLVGRESKSGIALISTATSWKQINRAISSRYEATIREPLPQPFAAVVRQARKAPSSERKIELVADELHKLITYSGEWKTLESGLFPRPHTAVVKSARGDCKDYAVSMAAILRKLGFTAHVALTSRNPQMPSPEFIEKLAKFPSLNFNHAIVWAKDPAGHAWWVDPTNPKVIAGVLAPDILGGVALVLDGKSDAVERLPLKNTTPSEIQIVQNVRAKPDDSVDVSARLTFNPVAYNGMGMIEATIGKENMKAVLSRLLNPIVKATSSYTLSELDGKFTYDIHMNAGGWVNDRKGKSYEIYINHPVTLLFLRAGDGGNGWDFGEEGTVSEVTTLQGLKPLDPIDHDCLARSPWLDFDRTVEADGANTKITDLVTVHRRFASAAEVKSDEFTNLVDDMKACMLAGKIVTFLNPTEKTVAQVALDKLKGPPVEKMTEADAEALNNETNLNLRTYILKKLYRYRTVRMQAAPQEIESYWRRANAVRAMGYDSGKKYFGGYLEAAMADVKRGLALSADKFDLDLNATKVSLEVDLKQRTAAIHDFTELYAKAPSEFQTLYAGFKLNSELLGRDAEAEKWLRLAIPRAVREADKRQSRSDLAYILSRERRHQQALAEYEEILKGPNPSAWTWHNAAIEYYEMKNYDKCIEYERKALGIAEFGAARGTLADALAYKAWAIQQSDKKQDAEPLYLEALKWDGANIVALVGLSRLNLDLAQSSQNQERWQQGRSYLDKAILKSPNDRTVIETRHMYESSRAPASAQ